MSRKQIRVMVVDDSRVIRELIGDGLAAHPDLIVVGSCADGIEALASLEALRPDVVTLDLQMPRMDGLETLDRLLTCRPTPVIVVSALTQRAADVTLQALDRGAMDYVAKPDGLADMKRVFGEELPQKIRNMCGADVRRVLQLRRTKQLRTAVRSVATTTTNERADRYTGCIAIGISTGGPPALAQLFGALVPPLPPIVIVQHMPQMFTSPFANRLNSLSSIRVREASQGDILRPNEALVAPGGKHLSLRRTGGRVEVVISDGDPVSGHKPSVDVMMRSAAQTFGKACVGVIMTGMGRDGADGCGLIRAVGGYVLGQDEGSSDVYGMNKVAFVEGHVDVQTALQNLPEAIAVQARRRCVGTNPAAVTTQALPLKKGF
ncbi:MAG: chemotaxis response regulator protein-glutamate methylesterase [Planctomycetia bacterium]|nr:chemotaxis response regulator protein-glutamate methylesterase [Planctomycetia bacterium]